MYVCEEETRARKSNILKKVEKFHFLRWRLIHLYEILLFIYYISFICLQTYKIVLFFFG